MKRLATTIAFALAAAVAPATQAAAVDEKHKNGPMLTEHLDQTALYFSGLDGSRRKAPESLAQLGVGLSDFAPDGAALASVVYRVVSDDLRGVVELSRADGTRQSLGVVPDGWNAAFVSWSGGGDYVLVVVQRYDESTGNTFSALWRYQPGAVAEKVIDLPVSHPEKSGLSGFAADGRTSTFYFGGDDGSVQSLDTSEATAAPSEVWPACGNGRGCSSEITNIDDLDVVNGRLLVGSGPGIDADGHIVGDWFGASWLSLGSQQVVQWRRFAEDTQDDDWGPMRVAPDGALVLALDYDDEGRATSVLRTSDARAAIVKKVAGQAIAWQPCPGGDCPVFVTPATAPQTPRAVKAASGARGKPVTAKASWNAPAADGGKPVLRYQVDAARVRSNGTIVKHTLRTAAVSARSLSVQLPAGRYKFRVRAANSVGYGPWSTYSSVARAR